MRFSYFGWLIVLVGLVVARDRAAAMRSRPIASSCRYAPTAVVGMVAGRWPS